MIMTMLTAAAALAQAYGPPPTAPIALPAPAAASPAAAPAATPAGRGLKDLPNTTITYYDVKGRTGPAIEQSWNKMLTNRASKDSVQLFTWKAGAKVAKRTDGQKCTVESAQSTMTNIVRLPRLAEEAKVSKDVLASWKGNVDVAESDAAANLWFISDGLRGIDQSMVGLPCDQATPTWNAGLEKLKLQQAEFAAQRTKAMKKSAKED